MVGQNYFDMNDCVSETTRQLNLHMSFKHNMVLSLYAKAVQQTFPVKEWSYANAIDSYH